MARQKGVLKLQGQMGGVSFYRSQKDGYLAREKGGVDAQRIKNDPNFARTRENGAEFGRAGAAGKLLRTALRALIINTRDSRMTSRLTKDMVSVIQADLTSTRGLRNVVDGEAELLEGFEFNSSAKLNRTLFAPYTTNIDRAGGTTVIDVPAFIPNQMIALPQGATHFRLVSAVAEIDFEAGVFVVNSSKTVELAINEVATAAVALNNAFTAASAHPAFLVFGVEFLQQVNGAYYPLKNGVHNPLSIVKVDGGV
jgi:hypothetical protein